SHSPCSSIFHEGGIESDSSACAAASAIGRPIFLQIFFRGVYMFVPFELRSAARQVGMDVNRVFDFDGKEMEGHYQLVRGDYIRMSGNYEQIMDAIKKSSKPMQQD